ncbi:hypothetical protein MUG78_17225 [Gordonia alkaliphila]|uniref:hypothetical protein n=1 Tax=Gordonia alkaliphila TaxID=1053547 RepID=UPI001FF3F129|nr:hypothetical protein [Gordonia alkaliphila]MCK0441144.1 hypothetical protein [Gordonia alkaliphila]
MSSSPTPIERFFLEYAVFNGEPHSPAGEYTSLQVTAADATALLAEFTAPECSAEDLIGHYFAQRLADGAVRVTKYGSADELNEVQTSIHAQHERWLQESGRSTSPSE